MAVLGTIYYPEDTTAETCEYSITYSEDSAQQTTVAVVSSINNVKTGVTVDIPSSVTLNGTRAVTTIASSAASQKIQVANVILKIPNSIIRIGSSAFSSCSGIAEVRYDGSFAQWCFIDFTDMSANPLCNEGELYHIAFYTDDKNTEFDDDFIVTSEFDQLIQTKTFNGLAISSTFKRNKVTKIELDSGLSSDFRTTGSNSIYNGNTIIEEGNNDRILIYRNTVLFGAPYCLLEDMDGENVTDIGFGAFASCFLYTTSTKTTQYIPETIKTIQSHAFGGNKTCYLSLPQGLEFFDGSLSDTFNYKNIPYGVDGVLGYLYNYNRGGNRKNPTINIPIILFRNGQQASDNKFYSYSVPNGVRIIHQAAFIVTNKNSAGATDDRYHKEKRVLAFVDIPDSVVYIGQQAFQGNYINDYDNTIIYKENVSVLYNNKAYRCIKAFEIANEALPTNTEYWEERSPYLLINWGKENEKGYKENTYLSNVSYFGNIAFEHSPINNKDSTIIFSNNVNAIPTYCFSSVDGIKTFKFLDGSQCKTLKASAFSNSIAEKIILPKALELIDESSFYNNQYLKKIIINNLNNLSINSQAFKYCASLEHITLPNLATDIPGQCFYNCRSLKTIYINPSAAISFSSSALTNVWADIICPEGDTLLSYDNKMTTNQYYKLNKLYDQFVSKVKAALENGTSTTINNIQLDWSGVSSSDYSKYISWIQRRLNFQARQEGKSVSLSTNEITGSGNSYSYTYNENISPKVFSAAYNKNPYNFYDYYAFERVRNLVTNKIKTDFAIVSGDVDISKLTEILDKVDYAGETLVVNELFNYDNKDKTGYDPYNLQYVYFDPVENKWKFNLQLQETTGQVLPLDKFVNLYEILQANYPTKKIVELVQQKLNELRDARISWTGTRQILDKSAYYKWLRDRKDYTFKDGDGVDYVYDNPESITDAITGYILEFNENGVAATKI